LCLSKWYWTEIRSEQVCRNLIGWCQQIVTSLELQQYSTAHIFRYSKFLLQESTAVCRMFTADSRLFYFDAIVPNQLKQFDVTQHFTIVCFAQLLHISAECLCGRNQRYIIGDFQLFSFNQHTLCIQTATYWSCQYISSHVLAVSYSVFSPTLTRFTDVFFFQDVNRVTNVRSVIIRVKQSFVIGYYLWLLAHCKHILRYSTLIIITVWWCYCLHIAWQIVD
jgi:hypothetical protein